MLKCKKFIAIFMAVFMFSFVLAGRTIHASEDMDQDVFDGWSDENRESALMSFEATDWNTIADQLILDGSVRKGLQAKDLSKKVKDLEPVVKETLKGCNSRNETPSSQYAPLILAMIEAVSGGNPPADDPCCVAQYFLRSASITSPQSSIRFLFNRIQIMEEAYNSVHKPKASIKKKNDGLDVVIEAVMLREEYAKKTAKYTKVEAEKYYTENKEAVFDPIDIVPMTDFAERVGKHVTVVESVSSASITWSGEMTSAMQKVCDAARNGKSTRAAKSGYCAAWVSGVYEYALGYYPGGNAIDYWRSWSSSGSRDSGNIPPGAAVVGTGSGTVYGHVGIYVGNGQVAENIGGYRVVSLERWISWQSSKPSKISGEKGWIGWVWPCKKDLSKS